MSTLDFSDRLSCSGDNALKDGHVVLIMEVKQNERTFSDYPNRTECYMTIINMYEEYRAACCQRSEGDLKEFCNWLNDFYRIEMFIFDKEIARYRHLTRDQLMKEFEENDDKKTVRTNGVSNRFTNGFGGSNDTIHEDGDELTYDWDI